MDVETAANSFIQLYEFLPTEDTSLDEPVVVTFQQQITTQNGRLCLMATRPHDVEGVLTSDSTVTVQPIHALVFLDERHAGIIGAGEFYDDQFDMAVESPQEAFLTDFATEFNKGGNWSTTL